MDFLIAHQMKIQEEIGDINSISEQITPEMYNPVLKYKIESNKPSS